jgi:citrate synthase
LTKINVEAREGALAQVTMSAAEAADRLGVKMATLYAYVSRGVLSRRRSGTGQSLFDAGEVERLARRGRPRRAAVPADPHNDVVIESRITALGTDRPYYRGRDALDLAGAASFEAVAEWLWTGEEVEPPPWQAADMAVSAAQAAPSGLPRATLPLERLQLIVPALAASDPLRANLDPDTVVDVGRALIAGMVESLPGPDMPGRITNRLWAKLGPARPRSRLIDALRAAMVVLADHELAASTFAVRVAASVRADPYAAVMAGLATMSGPLHGGASLGAERLLAEAGTPSAAGDAIGLRLRQGERIPGLGHMVYAPTDARAVTLLETVRSYAASHPVLAVADAILAEARRRRLPEPNIDFALAVLTRVAGMPIGSGEAIFAVARTAGWLAHAREEYAHRTRLRPRAVYSGPPTG